MNRSTILRTSSFCLVAAGLALAGVSSAEAQGFERTTQVDAYLVTGFGGQATAEQGGFSGDADLDTTVGVGFRLELPISSRITFGPIAELASYKLEGSSGRDLAVDAGAILRVGQLLDVGAMVLDLYGAVPAGFTAYFPDDSTGSDTFLGFNVGLLGGGQLHVTERVGVLVELGWQMHRVYEDDANLTANQFRMNLGAVVRL